jgi:simple sugar transport system ATP-binding protein
MNALEFRGVSKRFGSFYANRGLSFQVRAGTIHGLIGENGAGKSTAMKALFGIYPIDEGEILIKGKPAKIKSPVQAMKRGIGMVHQHFMLAGTETVLDNIILGHEPGFFRINREKALAQLESISVTYGLKFTKWTSPVSELSVGEQQRVEILKLLYQKSEVLILDEPTAVLTPQEVKELFQNLRKLKEEGKTIILISHKLKEVLEFTDEVTVMRRGEGVGTKMTAETNEDELAQMMVGRPVSFTYQGERKMFAEGQGVRPVLRVEALTVESPSEPVRKVGFELKPGEILGIAGVQGNGQTTLLRYLTHPAKHAKISRGNYSVKGADVTGLDPLGLRESGVGLVPEDRLSEALLLHQDLTENFLLGQHQDSRYQSRGFLNRAKVRSVVESKIKEFDIRPPFTTVWTGRMSGGNQQKLVIARALDSNPEVLLIAHPTRGVDVGAIEKIHDAIVQERNRGKAILLFSSELDELIDLSDRILVFYNGSIKAEYARREFDAWSMGRVMGGGEK